MSATTGILEPQREEMWRSFLSHNEIPRWLLVMLEPTTVLDALWRSVPEFAIGEWVPQSCKVKHVRLQWDEGCWMGNYILKIHQPHTGDKRTVTLQGTLYPPNVAFPASDHQTTARGFATEGWKILVPELRMQFDLPPSDIELPVLPQLTDPEQARALLETSIRAAGPTYKEMRIASCMPQMMRSHVGMRHTLRYSLTYADAGASLHWPPLVVAKTYDSEMGEHAYNSMRALWESPLASGDVVNIAEPLSYVPDIKLLVQGPIYEEQTLEEMVESAVQLNTPQSLNELRTFLQKAATGLAALHNSGVTYGPHWQWQGELEEIEEKLQALGQPLPDVLAAAAPLMSYLHAYDASHPADDVVPAHGAFRPAQVLIHQGRIGFIDFDGFCQAEPAMDLARFTASIRDVALTALYGKALQDEEVVIDEAERAERISEVELICADFIEQYSSLRPFSRARLALWEVSNHLTIVISSWLKAKPMRLVNTLALLEGRLRSMP